MPLNNKHLLPSVINIIREIPMDRESAPKDYPYQTKVDIYDKMCANCPFARIEIYPHNLLNVKPIVVKDINTATDLVMRNDGRLIRSCEYPFDITEKNNRII